MKVWSGAAVASVGLVAVWFGSSRQRGSDGPQAATVQHPSAAAHAASKPPVTLDEHIDVADLQTRTRFAFHREQDKLVGGTASYVAIVDDASVAVRPEVTDKTGATTRSGAPLELTTRSVTRTAAPGASTAASPYAIAPEGHLVAARDDSSETLRNSDKGLEQAWEFESAPRGTGDLEVRVAASGERYVTSTRSGIHFIDDTSGLGIAYSNARWVDANGKATDIAVAYEDHDIVMRVPSALVESSAYPATLDPTVGAEFSVDNPVNEPAPDIQFHPAIGHSGIHNRDFLVVWADRRRSLGPDYPFDIFGAHVDAAGNVIETLGFIVSPVAQGGLFDTHTQPTVAWVPDATGTDGTYVVLFSSGVTSTATTIEGALLQGSSSTTPQAISLTGLTCSSTCSHPDLATNTYLDGIKLAATYTDGATTRVYGFHLSGTTVTADFDQLVASTGARPVIAGSTGLAGFATYWLVAYQTSSYAIGGARVDETGTVSSLGNIIPGSVSSPCDGPDVAFVGNTGKWFVVADCDNDPTQLWDYDVRLTDVSTAGAVASSIDLIADNTVDSYGASVAGFGSGGTQGFVTWGETPKSGGGTTKVRGVRITDSPLNLIMPYVDIATSAEISSGESVAPVHSDDFSLYFTAWADTRNGSTPPTYPDIWGARINYSGTLLTPTNFPISQSSNAETSPAIAKCGSRYLVAWADTRGGFPSYDIYGSILDAAGNVLIQNIAISSATAQQDTPAVACNGTNFYVVWTDMRNGNADIYGTGVDASTGALLNVGGVPLVTELAADQHPAIAYSPVSGNYMVTWDTGSAVAYISVSGSAGTAVGTASLLLRGGSYPDIAWDGTEFWIVYQYELNGDYNIAGNTVSTSGTHGAQVTLDANASEQHYPRLANDSGAARLVVVYEDARDVVTQGGNIRGLRFTTAGVITETFIVADTTDVERGPRITTRDTGKQEVVYWTQSHGQPFNFDVYGQGIVNGVVSVKNHYTVSAQANIREMSPDIACTSTTSCTSVYRWFNTADTTTDADRTKARVITY